MTPVEATPESQFRYKQLFGILTAGTFLIFPILSFGFGITFDEWMDSNYGLLVLRFILSLGRDKEYLNFWHGYLYSGFYFSSLGFLYGTLFDTVKNFAYNGLHQDLHLFRFFTFSHFLTSLIGCTAALYTGLAAKELGKWRTACLAFLFMILSPRFLGNAMNDPKDIPFTASYIVSVYYTIRFLKELPTPKFSTICGLSAGIAISIGVRPVGLILIPYLVLATAYAWFYRWRIEHDRMKLSTIAAYVLVVCVYGYMGGLLFWPYGISNPFVNPFLAMAKIPNFSFWNYLVLFEGKQILAADLPWYYLPKWILISTPLFILAGLTGSLVMPRRILKYYGLKILPFIVFTFLFPPAYIIYKKSTVYDSWRHVFFVYPSLVVLAVLAWDYLLEISKMRRQAVLVTGLLLLHLCEPLSWMIRNHPNEYVYFNPLDGGLRGAFGRYETDYWSNANRQAAAWLAKYHSEKNGNQPAVVRSEGHMMCTYPFLRKALGTAYVPFEFPEGYPKIDPYFFFSSPPMYMTEIAQSQPWDYAIALTRNWPPDALLRGAWPPPGTLHEIKADGVSLAAVVKNPHSRLQ